MDKSGLTRAIEGLPLQMQAMGQQMALTEKDTDEHSALMKILISSLDTDVMLNIMAAYSKNEFSNAEVQSLLAWLNTELTSKVINAELQATEPEFQQNLMRYIADLQTTPPTQQRSQMVINFVESSGMVEQALNMIHGLVKNMFAAVKANDPQNTELATQLDTQLEQMMAMMKPSMEQQMVLTSYYIYRDISDAELAQYSKFYTQDLGAKYLSTVYTGLGKAMSNWGTNLVSQIESAKKQD